MSIKELYETLEKGTAKEVKFVSVEVKPAEAERLLIFNQGNRHLNKAMTSFLTKEIKEGRWTRNGETIKFAKSGRLVDGQHRLNAISRSGKKVTLDVILGLEEESFNTIDTGKSRTASDVLSAHGFKYHSQLSVIIRWVLKHDKKGYFVLADGKQSSISNKEVLEYAQEHPELGEDVVYVMSLYNKSDKTITVGFAGAMLVLLRRIDEKKADDFVYKMMTGAMLEPDDPISILRRRFAIDKNNTLRMTPMQKLALIILAWNAWIKGEKDPMMRYAPSKSNFPKIDTQIALEV